MNGNQQQQQQPPPPPPYQSHQQQQQQQHLLLPPQHPPPPPPPPPQDGSSAYDPRRLFPFGLSPIPELPSELASEVSTTCPTPSCHSDDDEEEEEEEEEESEEEDEEEEEDEDEEYESDEEDTGTEVESVRSAGARSVRSVETLGEGDEEEEEEEEEEDEEEEEETDEEEVEEAKEPKGEEKNTDSSADVGSETNQETPTDQTSPTTTTTTAEESSKEEENGAGEDDPGGAAASGATVEMAGVVVLDPSQLEEISGAETASEIFRHLQATTRDKSEVTTELAKILSVLETTLQSKSADEGREDDESSSDADEDEVARRIREQLVNVVTRKPPRHPNAVARKSQADSAAATGAPVDARSTRPKKKAGDEMSILSKILITLLCSCKTTAAAGELRKVIRQFRETAKEATDQVGEEINSNSSGRSSRSGCGGKRSLRTRRSSGSSSHSEADSLTNTLTPNNTESKSSEDEGASIKAEEGEDANGKIRFSAKVEEVKTTIATTNDQSVSVTISIPRRNSTGTVFACEPVMEERVRSEAGDEDWKDEEADVVSSTLDSPRTKRQSQMGRNDSTSSESTRELSSSEGRSETRKLLSDMECGAYNSDSLNSPGHSGISDLGTSERSHESSAVAEPEESDDAGWSTDESVPQEGKVLVGCHQQQEVEGQLINHLEETFKVLNGAYRIITGSSTYHSDDDGSSQRTVKERQCEESGSGSSSGNEGNKSFEDVLQGVTDQAVRLENEIRQGSTPRSVEPSSRPASHGPGERSTTTDSHAFAEKELAKPDCLPSSTQIAATVARPTSQASRTPSRAKRPSSAIGGGGGSRAASRLRSRPASRQTGKEAEEEEEEDWGDEDEWEYYYEDEEEEEASAPQQAQEEAKPAPCAAASQEQTKSEINNIPEEKPDVHPLSSSTSSSTSAALPQPSNPSKPNSRPSSRQRRLLPSSRPNSRPNSRSGSRPTSRASRLGMRTPLKGIGEDEEYDDDDEWEYYYEDEEEEELNRLSPAATTAPTTRATSPFPMQAAEKQQELQAEPSKQGAAKCTKIPDIEVRNPTLVTPVTWEEVSKEDFATTDDYIEAKVEEKIHRDFLSSISEVSVALAAEYLGQAKAEDVAAALRDEENGEFKLKQRKHKKHKKSRAECQESPDNRKQRKKHRNKKQKSKDGDEKKFLPKLGVKALVSKLEPKLFKDSSSGTKMVMSPESARSSIKDQKSKQKKKEKHVEAITDEPGMPKRRSVMEIVQSMTSSKRDQSSKDKAGFVDPMDAKFVGRVIETKVDPVQAPPLPVAPPAGPVIGSPRTLRHLQQSHPLFQSYPDTNHMLVIQDGSSHSVQMRTKRGFQPAPTRGSPRELLSELKSPDSSEAYGTGSSTSEDKDDSRAKSQHLQHQEGMSEAAAAAGADLKPGSRHSRLFKLLQDSDYSDSDSSNDKSDTNRISLKGMTGANTASVIKEPMDLEALVGGDGVGGSLGRVAKLGRGGGGRDSAADCCDTSSVASSFSFAKGSPVVTRRELHVRQATMSMGLQQSASFCLPLSTDVTGALASSPGDTLERHHQSRTRCGSSTGAVPKYHQQQHQQHQQQYHPATRVWSYLQDEFDCADQSSAGVAAAGAVMGCAATTPDDSSYHSQSHSLVSLESMMLTTSPEGEILLNKTLHTHTKKRPNWHLHARADTYNGCTLERVPKKLRTCQFSTCLLSNPGGS